MSESENKAVIQRFIKDVLNLGRLETADEIVAENFIELDPLPGQKQGREGLKEIIVMLRSGFPDMNWVIEEMIASGESVKVKGVVIDRIVGGRMTESRILMDDLGMMQQLGVIPAPA
jgi:predicted ester cyclase